MLLRLTLVAALATLVTPDGAAAQGAAPITRRVYLNAFDGSGATVSDLTADDFSVKEGGKSRDVVVVRPAQALMQIVVIVDDNGTGLFRAPLYRFIQKLQPHAEFSIVEVVGQPLKLTDFTRDGHVLSEALNNLAVRPSTPDGGQLLQGIYEAAKDLEKREAGRPIIIALSVPGEEHTTLPARHVLDKLKDSGASLNVFLVATSASRQTVAVTKPSALLEENMNLGEVLGDGSKQSGGIRADIVASAGALGGLQRLADDLIHQVIVEYDLPAGTKPSDRVAISVKRKGVSLRVPTRIPDR